MQVDRGIALPDNLESTGYTCLKVYIPTDEDGFYLSAFSGMFSLLGVWLTWEKDGTTRAAQAAEIWRDAIDYTHENGWVDACEEEMTDITPIVDELVLFRTALVACCDALGIKMDGITEAIDGVSFSTVTNQYLDCAGCDNLPPYTDPMEDETPDPNNPPNNIPPAEWNDYRCRATNYLWDTQVDNLLLDLVQILNTVASGAVLGALIALLAASGVGIPVALGVILIELGLLLINENDVQNVDSDLDLARQLIICAIYTSDTTVEALAYINEIIDTLPFQTDHTKGWITNTIGNHYAINLIYTGQVDVPEDYESPMDCENVCVDPDPNPGWELNTVIGGYGAGSVIDITQNNDLQYLCDFSITPADPLHTRMVMSNEYNHQNLTAVTFFGDWDTNYLGGGELIKFGGDNSTIWIGNQRADWFCIKLLGSPTPPPPQGQPFYDQILEVPDVSYLQGNFWVDYFGQNAPTIVGVMNVYQFTRWTL